MLLAEKKFWGHPGWNAGGMDWVEGRGGNWGERGGGGNGEAVEMAPKSFEWDEGRSKKWEVGWVAHCNS